jgi:hypothetical protein
MSREAPPLTELSGMWRRSLIIHANGVRDASTQVRWLQAQSLFVDLRQGADLPDFLHRRCLNDLTPDDCAQLAQQEGFAGRFGLDGDCFEWQRLIDFQPGRSGADAARLWWEEQVLVETGRDSPYIEHWLRDPTVVTRPLAALRLRDHQSGVTALAVHAGTVFMFARERAVQLPAGQSLVECVAAARSLAEARAMLDCEITLGSAGPAGANVILASTHPWRVAERFELGCTDSGATTTDCNPAGEPGTRNWEIIEAEGDPQAVWPGR